MLVCDVHEVLVDSRILAHIGRTTIVEHSKRMLSNPVHIEQYHLGLVRACKIMSRTHMMHVLELIPSPLQS